MVMFDLKQRIERLVQYTEREAKEAKLNEKYFEDIKIKGEYKGKRIVYELMNELLRQEIEIEENMKPW